MLPITNGGLGRTRPPLARRQNTVMSLREILWGLTHHIGEPSLWAVLRECVMALKNREQRPVYVSLDTVTIVPSGIIKFVPVSPQDDLDEFFLAPELEKQGIISEKSCIFGVAQTVLAAATLCLPSSQGPQLSERFQQLLARMTEPDAEKRLSISAVLKDCNEYQNQTGILTQEICMMLRMEAMHGQALHMQEQSSGQQGAKTEPRSPPPCPARASRAAPASCSHSGNDHSANQGRSGFLPVASASKFEAVRGPVPTKTPPHAGGANHNPERSMSVDDGAPQSPRCRILRQKTWTNTGHCKVSRQRGVDADHTTAQLPSDATAATAGGQTQPSWRQSENRNPCQPAASPAPQQCFSLVLDSSSGNYLLVPVSPPQDPGSAAATPAPVANNSPLVMMSSPAAGNYAGAVQYGAQGAACARGNWPNSNGDGFGPDHRASPECGGPASPERAANWSSHSGPPRQPAAPVGRARGRAEQWSTSTPVQGHGEAATGRRAVASRARGNGSFGGRACSLSPDLEFRRAAMWAAQGQAHLGSYDGCGTQISGYSAEAQRGGSRQAPAPPPGRHRTPSSPEVGPSSPQGQNGQAGAAEGPHSPRPISPQQQRILRLLREEFAFEGYMENGAVEMEMAEFIRALRVLNLKAFSYLVKERYPDLYWDDGLLRKLHSRDTVPTPKIQSRPSFRKPPSSQPDVERRSIDCTGPEPVTSNAGGRSQGAAGAQPGLRSSRSQTWSESMFRQHGAPRSAGKSATPGSGESQRSGSKATGRSQCTDPGPAVPCGNSSEVLAPERLPDDQTGIHVWKSVCQKNTGIGEGSGNPAALPALRRPISCQSANSSLSELYSRESWEGTEGDSALGPSVSLGWPGGESRGGSDGGGIGSRLTNNNGSGGGSTAGGDGGSGSYSGDGASGGAPSSDFPCPSGPQPTCLGWALAFRGEADFNGEIKKYAQTLGRKHGQGAGLEERLQELEQQLMLEKKNLKKTQTYYRKLTQGSVKGKSGGERGLLLKLTSQMEETQDKVELMHFVRSYLELLMAEQCGLNLYDLPSLKTSRFAGPLSPDSVTDTGEEAHATAVGDAEDAAAAPPTFGLLFQAAAPKDGSPKESTAFVHAGTPLGLMSYLYAKNALSQGYVHQFFYTYRYFVSPQQLLSFIMDQFINAASVYTPHSSKICQRSVDLLHMWLQTCYRVDVLGDAELNSTLQGFILNKVISYHETAGQHLLHHSSHSGHSEGQGSVSSLEEDDDYAVFSPGPASARASLDIGAARRARSTSGIRDQHKVRPPVQQQMSVSGCMGIFRHLSLVNERDTSVYKHSAKGPAGASALANYTATQIALQLTLLEEVKFKSCLPVHFMNTRAQGIRENLQPGINRLTICSPEGVSLFVPDCKPRGTLWKFLDHSANISTWVSAEILSCDSIKTQLAVLSKFLYVAKTCSSLRNFASSMQILSGLENFTVRQLPVWRSLPSKAMAIMEELVAVKVFLKSDSECLLEADTSQPKPTIPCPHLFAMHVQQLEIGGFTMANKMYKWPKLRSLARTVHQIAVFQSRTYALAPPDEELQAQLRARIRRFRGADLQALAAQHEPNYHRQPVERNSRKVHEVLAKVRATFQ